MLTLLAIIWLSTQGVLSAAPQTIRFYMIGNSVSDQINHTDFRDMVSSRGHTMAIGKDSIPGAAIAWHRDNPESGFTLNPYGQYPFAFANFAWDALSLQPFSDYGTELAAAQAMVDDFSALHPAATVYVYAQSLNAQTDSWDRGDWLAARGAVAGRNAAWFADFTNELQASRPSTTVRMVPVGHVFWELHQRAQAGLLPGFTHINQFYQDGWHYPTPGDYIVMMTYYATLLGESPQGMARFSPYDTLDPQVAAQIEEAAWHVVQRTPLSGRELPLIIETPSLPAGLANAPYHASLQVYPAAAASFSLRSGTLPAGLTLSSVGELSGTPTENGIYFLTIEAQSGELTADRDLILTIASDNVPVITSQTVQPVARGAYTRQQLRHEGGIGGVGWSVGEGQLPYGLHLSANGELAGTPWSEPGNYRVLLQVTDNNPVSPSVVIREVNIPILEPETPTLQVAPLAAPPGIDGALSEPFWNAAVPIDRALAGSPDNSAAFDVRYDAQGLYFAFAVTDATIFSGTGEWFHDDAVIVYLDGLHRRESEFNANDREILMGADGSLIETNGRDTGMVAAVDRNAGGYTAELFVPWSNFDEPPTRFPASLGLDVAVVDNDGAPRRDSWLAWVSATPAVRGPFQFGNLNLLSGPLQRNILRNGDFEEQRIAASLLNAVPIQTTHAGIGWVNGPSHRNFNDIGYNKGFPQTAMEAVRPVDGSLLQLVHDGRVTTGKGWLSIDAYNPSASVPVRVWGYRGSAAEVDGKLASAPAAIATTANPTGGAFDGLIASATLAPGDTPANTWTRFTIPADFADGYDYALIAFGGPDSVVTLRLDNVALGAEAGTTLTYQPLPTTDAPAPVANLLLNPGFESARAGTLGFNVAIQTAQADLGWFTNPTSSRAFAQFVSGKGNPGSAAAANGTQDGAALQLIHDARRTTGMGLLQFHAWNPEVKIRVSVWGYNGSASEVNAKLAAATNQRTPSAGNADGILFDSVINRTGSLADAWEEYAYAINFADGYDYILIALAAFSGVEDSYIDNLRLSTSALQFPAPTLSIGSSASSVAEWPAEDANWHVSAEHASPLAIPLQLHFSGTAATDGSDGDFVPEFAVLPARANRIDFFLQPHADGQPEGTESLVIQLQPTPQYNVASANSLSIAILDHPLDQWLMTQFGGLPDNPVNDNGLHYLLEYFSGLRTPPLMPAAQPLRIVDYHAAQGELSFSVLADPAATGISAAIEASTDLLNWTSFDLSAPELIVRNTETLANGAVLTTYAIATDAIAGSGSGADAPQPLFLRLSVH